MKEATLKENIIHDFFEAVVFLKGVNGLWEIVLGAVFFWLKPETINHWLFSLSQQKVIKGPGHFASGYLSRQAETFSQNTHKPCLHMQ